MKYTSYILDEFTEAVFFLSKDEKCDNLTSDEALLSSVLFHELIPGTCITLLCICLAYI